MLETQIVSKSLRLLVYSLTVAAFLVFFGGHTLAQGAQIDDEPVIVDTAQEGAVQEQQTPNPSSADLPESFDYVAEECNNLTLLVRKSIQVYDAESEEVDLSPAQIIYAETNVVQKLGSFLLDIGDEVSVPKDMVEKYAQSSQDLSSGTLAAWDTYTSNVDFDLTDIQPANVEVAEDNTIIPDDNKLVDQSPLTEINAGDSDDSASPIWWFVGIGAVLLLWYVLWRRQDEDLV